MRRRESRPGAGLMTDSELNAAQEAVLQAIALKAAQEGCRMGYKPAIVAKVVRMDDHTFLELLEWYRQWTTEEGR